MNRSVTYNEVMTRLQSLANPAHVEGQQRFGISGDKMLGISIYELRRIAAGIKDHELALQLWQSGVHDARLLASMVDDAALVTRAQMEDWVKDFDSWDVCDQVCDNLFAHVEGIAGVIPQWAEREEEFVRRAAFATIAVLAWYDNLATDETVAGFLPLIEKFAIDPRNFVKKAVNWALRNIGKRRPALRGQAVQCARKLLEIDSPTARWIAKDALREFEQKFGPLENLKGG